MSTQIFNKNYLQHWIDVMIHPIAMDIFRRYLMLMTNLTHSYSDNVLDLVFIIKHLYYIPINSIRISTLLSFIVLHTYNFRTTIYVYLLF